MREKTNHNEHGLRFLNHFLCAGSSALLLSIAHIYPSCWYFSFIALVPFLWRCRKANLSGAIVVGMILACCFSFVSFTGELLSSPYLFFHKLILLNLIFSIFSLTVILAIRYLSFNPIFIAAFWLPLEYFLGYYAGFGNILTFAEIKSSFVIRFSSMFSCLMISFIIVLIKSIILMFIEHIYCKGNSDSKFRFSKEKLSCLCSENILPLKNWYYILNPRAPPLGFTI